MTAFSDSVYKIVKAIPKGKVTTYKAIAEALNNKAYRAVGNALNRNPYAPVVPCHRVINSNGSLGGFKSGIKNKIKLLKQENIIIKNSKIDLKKYFFKIKKRGRKALLDLSSLSSRRSS